MNERLTIQDLTDLLAAKHGMTKKDAEAFVKEFFLLIEQALENEKNVKIKGLGTFRLIDVDSRESVNVNTGERFQIKGHTKVTFAPDTILREVINKPFAHFETVVLNDNTLLEDTPVEEMEEDEIGKDTSIPIVEDKLIQDIKEQQDEKPDLESGIVQQTDESSEVFIIELQPESATEDAKIAAEKIIAQELLKANLKPEILEIPHTVKVEQPVDATFRKDKSPVPYLITIIVFVVLLCGGAILFVYYSDMFSLTPNKDVIDMPVAAQPAQPELQLIDTIEKKGTVIEVAPETPKVIALPQIPIKKVMEDSATYTIVGTKASYTIKEGETLTKVALHFYGTKALWPYIVKHNSEVLKNPDNVPYGTTIKIPDLEKK